MDRRKYGIYFNITDIEFINETIGLIEAYSTTYNMFSKKAIAKWQGWSWN